MVEKNDLISVETQLVAQRFLNGMDLVPKPFSEDIYVMSTDVAGTRYVDGIEQLMAELQEGDELLLVREPDNMYDQLAILVLDAKKRKLGYIPRRKNEVVARLMDAGKRFYAQVRKVESQGEVSNWKYIYIAVFMVELN